jgi:hypothetical protein
MFYLKFHKSDYDYDNCEFELKIRMGEHVVALMNHSLDNDMLNAVDHMDLGLPF